ncbi:DJ-1/PfpI family protein [Nocardia sp. NPDC052112]|uniref:DJ-1/PfpI family protein n=1 Tax=Nocardia sp. NPDC052112 TaxID=3155646 RepID=UPI00343CC8AA
MRAQFVLFDGFDPLDVIAPFEVLDAGCLVTDGESTVEFVSAEGARQVPSGIPAISLEATARLDPDRADLILVPGAVGKLPDGPSDRRPETIPMIIARSLGTELPALLRAAVERTDTTVATVCGGSLVLAMAGLIKGRCATTHHIAMDTLSGAGVNAVAARVVDDGDLISGANVTSGLDLGLYLLERELGPRIANAVEKLFAHERRGTVWRNTGRTPAIAV